MRIIGGTHKGMKRFNNQDCFAVSAGQHQCWAVVCDGVGGANGGEVASRTACEFIAGALRRCVMPSTTQSSIENIIISACAGANAEIYDLQKEKLALRGMGTTLVGAVVQNGLATIFWAGDSRAYLLRGQQLSQLTTDHTVVQHLVDTGKLSPKEALAHPDRNHITRALGVEREVRIEFYIHSMDAKDSILLCSDGVYNYMDHQELEAITAMCTSKASVDPIIDSANLGGGGDNITAVIITPLSQEVARS